MRNKVFRFVLPLLIIVVGIGAFVSLKATAPVLAPEVSREKVWPIHTKKLVIENVRPEITEFGTVVAGNQADLRPLVSGRIVEVGRNYFEGAIITAGDTLAVIDPFDYKIEVADRAAALTEVITKGAETRAEIGSETQLLAISKSQLNLRKRDFNRRQKLAKQGSTSRKSLDDSEIAFNEASQAVALRQQTILRLENRLEQYEASVIRARSALDLAKRNLSETKLVAPFSGFLANAEVSIGQRVGTSDRIARLIEADRMEVRFRLTERDFSGLLETTNKIPQSRSTSSELINKKVRVRWRVGDRYLEFRAVIERLGAEIDATSGGINVYARLFDIGLDTPLRPGAFVEIIVPARMYQNVVRVPDTAIVGELDVYLVENGRLIKQTIDVVRRVNSWVLIRGKSLEGKYVVTRPFPEMAAGIRVEPH